VNRELVPGSSFEVRGSWFVVRQFAVPFAVLMNYPVVRNHEMPFA
jgi:hypothetical protein